MPFCTECGAELKEGAKFCPECGAKVKLKAARSRASTPAARSRSRAAPEREIIAEEPPQEPEAEATAPPQQPEPQPEPAEAAPRAPARGRSKARTAARTVLIFLALSFVAIFIIGATYEPGSRTTTATQTTAASTTTRTTAITSTQPPITGDSYTIHQEWSYGGIDWTYDAQIYTASYQFFKDKPRSYDYGEYVDNPDDDAYMEEIAGQLENAAEEKGWSEFETVSFALAFVQSWPYTSDSVTTPYDEYPRYPVETLVDGGGDCEDTSILFSSIVRGMGYGTVLLHLEEDRHMAAGVLISQEMVDTWSQPYALTYYEHNGGIYAFCETTGEGWELGEKPEDWVSTSAIIIDV